MVENPITQRVALSPDGTPHMFFVTNRRAFQSGGVEQKFQVETADGKSYIERPFNETAVAGWSRFRQAGLFVPPEMFVDANQEFILVTDLKHDGSEIYGKGFKRCLRGIHGFTFDRRHPEMDIHFRYLTDPERFETLREEASTLAAQATEHRLRLPTDDPCELLIRPDGSHELVILDFKNFGTIPDEPEVAKQRLMRTNTIYTNQFLMDLQQIRTRLIIPWLDHPTFPQGN